MVGRGGPQTQGRPVGVPPAVQRPMLPVQVEYSPAARFTVYVLRPAWLWRREIACVLALAVLGGWAWGRFGFWLAVASIVAVVTVSLTVPVFRRTLGERLWRGRLRRRWDAACRFAGLATVNDRIPRVVRIRAVPAGERMRVRVPKGGTVEELASEAERVAVCLQVREVRVTRDVDRAHLADVEVIRRDPFLPGHGQAVGTVIGWPWADALRVNLWDPIPIGIDELGQPVWITLPGRNLLLGGEPGAGKSSALSVLIACAALDPTVRIWGLDAKRLELVLHS